MMGPVHDRALIDHKRILHVLENAYRSIPKFLLQQCFHFIAHDIIKASGCLSKAESPSGPIQLPYEYINHTSIQLTHSPQVVDCNLPLISSEVVSLIPFLNISSQAKVLGDMFPTASLIIQAL